MQRHLVVVLALSAAAFAAPAGAQILRPPRTPWPQRSPRSDESFVVRTHAIYSNPLSVFFAGDYVLEYEQAVRPMLSVGAGVNYQDEHSLFFSGDSGYDLDLSGKARYYPDEEALHGFSIAGTLGATIYKRPAGTGIGADRNGYDRQNTALTIGMSLDQNWLMGRDERLLVGIGAGAKRRFVAHPTDVDQFAPNRLTIRVVLGYAW